ncbi:MAG: methyl-accepting chemotaxis protein, partial [Oceanospirillales bacterium]|nr:methyl-accepting chemotaxis protein [Oceanospirillales bacterium]
MKLFRLKGKLLLFSIVPILMVTAAVMVTVYIEMAAMGQAEIDSVREGLISAKREELKNYVESAVTAVAPFVAKGGEEAKSQARDVLRAISFGDDGYIFVYDFDGNRIAYGPDPSSEGKNFISVKDPNGVRVIDELVSVSRKGGGYVEYDWLKPSAQAVLPKLSYAAGIDSWGWSLGTGVYIDDIDKIVETRRAEIKHKIDGTMLTVASMIAGILLLVVLVTL